LEAPLDGQIRLRVGQCAARQQSASAQLLRAGPGAAPRYRDRFGEAATLDSLGYCHHQAGRHRQAVTFYEHALDTYADIGERYYRAHTLIRLGETRQASGNPRAARDHWQQAAQLLDDLHHPDAENRPGEALSRCAAHRR